MGTPSADTKPRARQYGGGEVALTDAEVGRILGISADSVQKKRKSDPTFPRPVALLHPDGLKRTDRMAVIRWWRAQHEAAQAANHRAVGK
jgi:hypothetical protein